MNKTVQLDNMQYRSYDEDGVILATRAVRAKNISALSEMGPGIAIVLRTGTEGGNTDGVGVELTVTEAQLKELGYERTSSAMLDDLLAELGDYESEGFFSLFSADDIEGMIYDEPSLDFYCEVCDEAHE